MISHQLFAENQSFKRKQVLDLRRSLSPLKELCRCRLESFMSTEWTHLGCWWRLNLGFFCSKSWFANVPVAWDYPWESDVGIVLADDQSWRRPPLFGEGSRTESSFFLRCKWTADSGPMSCHVFFFGGCSVTPMSRALHPSRHYTALHEQHCWACFSGFCLWIWTIFCLRGLLNLKKRLWRFSDKPPM